VTSAMGRGAGASDQAAISTPGDRIRRDYTTLMNVLRGRAPSARIIALNLPNMGACRSCGRFGATASGAQLLSVGSDEDRDQSLAAQGALVFDMMCDPRSYQASTYSSDGFHPNDTGYAWMAEEVVSAAPRTTNHSEQLSQMSLIP